MAFILFCWQMNSTKNNEIGHSLHFHLLKCNEQQVKILTSAQQFARDQKPSKYFEVLALWSINLCRIVAEMLNCQSIFSFSLCYFTHDCPFSLARYGRLESGQLIQIMHLIVFNGIKNQIETKKKKEEKKNQMMNSSKLERKKSVWTTQTNFVDNMPLTQ